VEVPPEMELPLDPTAAVESELTNKPTATALPSPTPDLNLAPAMGMSSSIPLVLGGGLAAILVVGYMLVKRRRL
jgi:hypothetical protein